MGEHHVLYRRPACFNQTKCLSKTLKVAESNKIYVRLTAVRELVPIASGQELERASAARLALQGLSDDDSRMVRAAFTAALEETQVQLSTDVVDLGGLPPRVQQRWLKLRSWVVRSPQRPR